MLDLKLSLPAPPRGLLTPFLLVAATVAGCGGSPSMAPRGEGQPLRVIATVGMVADVVRNVGGGRVAVTQMMGAGVDPHLYKATRDDVAAVLASDAVFYCGLMLEGKMADTLVKVARDKPVFAVTERIDPARLLEPEDMAGHHDPHVWMDVAAWAETADAVAAALAELDAAHAEGFAERAACYKAELAELHDYGRRVVATIPEPSRVLITSHDAFNYFGRAYGLEVRGVQGVSTESEAGLQQINALVDLLVERGVRAVFVESSVPRKNIDALVEGAAARGHEVTVGGELFSDAMGADGSYEGTYQGMLDHNLSLVTRALGGEAPERGFRGRLGAEASAAAAPAGASP